MDTLKRKREWSSKGLLGLKTNNKMFIIEQLPVTSENLSQNVEMSVADNAPEKTGTGAKLRRTGSKLLSAVRFSTSSGKLISFALTQRLTIFGALATGNSSKSLKPRSEREIDVARVRDAAVPSTSSPIETDIFIDRLELETPCKSRTATILTVEPSVSQSAPITAAPTVMEILQDQSLTTKSSQSVIGDTQVNRCDQSGVNSTSASGLTHQLFHETSTTFGNPTVIHRPNLRSRPSIHSLHSASPQDSTAPSSFTNTSGSGSPGGRSTGQTSIDSNLRCPKLRDRSERFSPLGKNSTIESRIFEKFKALETTPLTPIEEMPAMMPPPTVVTVETTANAKIFFETHFDSVLSGKLSPRSLRRHELESRFQRKKMSSEQRQIEREIWQSKETEHLRRARVLKSRTNQMNGSGGVAVAGYEVVRVLGKGSFGVVRLVREKGSESGNTSFQSSTPTPTPAGVQNPREEFSLRAAAIEVLKSTRSPQHRGYPKPKREVFAMKVIRKSDMLRNSQEGHIRAERDFLVASENSRWVVPLIASFQDTHNLYLVMEYMVGGDFLGLLFRQDILREKKARWYIAEMILCVEEAHKLRWIHRDVKPDNFLISSSGHLKISDFGLAFDGHWAHDQTYFNNHRAALMDKLGIEVGGDSLDRKESKIIAAGIATANTCPERKERKELQERSQVESPADNEDILGWRNRKGKRKLARSVVGTSQYMAPEVIRGDLYDGRCDWWSIGIILYEVCSRPTFQRLGCILHKLIHGHLVLIWLYSLRM